MVSLQPCVLHENKISFFFNHCVFFLSCCTFRSLCCLQVVARGACSWQFWVWDKIQTSGRVSWKTPNLCHRCKCKKWIPKKAGWKAELQHLVSSGKQHNYWLQRCGITFVISNWKCRYLNPVLYKTWSNELPKSASLGTDKPILHCTRGPSLLYIATTKLVTTQPSFFLNAKFISSYRLRSGFPFFHIVFLYRKDI